MIDKQRLMELAESATPGPWHWVDPDTDVPYEEDDYVGCASLRTQWMRETKSVGPLPAFVIYYAEEINTEADAAYIAAVSPDVIIRLLKELEDKENRIQMAVEAFESLQSQVEALKQRYHRIPDITHS